MFTFADSFDFYATVNDLVAGYWDSGTPSGFTLVAGRFAGSQCLQSNTATIYLTKSSGTNDAVHHIVCAFNSIAALSGTSLGMYLSLIDNVTNQVSIVFRQDGAILLTSGAVGGTVLATYSGAVSAANTWTAFEFEVVISATVGRFRVRKNGNTSDDFDSGATLNTRPGTNAYANKLSVGMGNNVINNHRLDDLLWRSDPTSVAWMGDVRSYTRMPASDASTQFARSPVTTTQTLVPSVSMNITASTARYTLFTSPYSGTVGSIVCNLGSVFTGNMKCAIFANNAGAPSTVLGAATAPLVNPVAGANTFTFSPAVVVTKGTQYWVGFCTDTTVTSGWLSGTGGTGVASLATGPVYASWPSSSITGISTGQNTIASSFIVTPGTSAELVGETLQDGTATYVYDATVGHGDLYNIAAASPAPASVVAVTTRGFIEKSDAGARSGAVQLKSGGTTVQSTSTLLASSFTWLYRTDSTDPNTGSAWTPAAVDGVTIGPVVVS